jgi:hypothetical protein
MMQYRLYQGLLYFQKDIQFQGTYMNVISFILIRKVQHLHDSFPQSYKAGRRDCVVSISTRYKLKGPGIENREGGGNFPHPSRPVVGPTRPSTQRVPRLFPGSKLK